MDNVRRRVGKRVWGGDTERLVALVAHFYARDPHEVGEWPAQEVRRLAHHADAIEDARILRQSVAFRNGVIDAFRGSNLLLDLFFPPAWKTDTRTSEEIIADTLAAWGGKTVGN